MFGGGSAMTIDVRELPQKIEEAFAQSQAGVEVVIVDGGVPKAKLVPVAEETPPNRRVAGAHQGMIEMAPNFDEPMDDEFWGGRL
jgi:antitoxin (DNA-binding transcriptional repressor) of toxin-antitoxin stability system